MGGWVEGEYSLADCLNNFTLDRTYVILFEAKQT